MKWEDDYLIFSSGRKEYANRGILGIRDVTVRDSAESGVIITEGYDGGFPGDRLTAEERRELADYAIGLWERFAKDGAASDY